MADDRRREGRVPPPLDAAADHPEVVVAHLLRVELLNCIDIGDDRRREHDLDGNADNGETHLTT